MVIVSEQPLEPAKLLDELESNSMECGAIVSFTGKMREAGESGDPLAELYLEYYPMMTEASLNKIVADAKQRFNVNEVILSHRVGSIYPDQPIVFVAVASKHRRASFDAATMIMDYLKNEAPFWKKEIYQNGKEQWVAQKDSDRNAYSNWQ